MLLVVIGISLWVPGLETDLEHVELKERALAAATGHFLRDVFGGRAQVRNWWEACCAGLVRSAP